MVVIVRLPSEERGQLVSRGGDEVAQVERSGEERGVPGAMCGVIGELGAGGGAVAQVVMGGRALAVRFGDDHGGVLVATVRGGLERGPPEAGVAVGSFYQAGETVVAHEAAVEHDAVCRDGGVGEAGEEHLRHGGFYGCLVLASGVCHLMEELVSFLLGHEAIGAAPFAGPVREIGDGGACALLREGRPGQDDGRQQEKKGLEKLEGCAWLTHRCALQGCDAYCNEKAFSDKQAQAYTTTGELRKPW